MRGLTSALGAQPGRIRYSRRDQPTIGGLTLGIGSATKPSLSIGGFNSFYINSLGTESAAFYNSGSNTMNCYSSGWYVPNAGRFGLGTDTTLGRNSSGIAEIGISMGSGFGGSLKLTNLISVGTITPGSFTVATLPSAATNFSAVGVTDALNPVIGSVVAGSNGALTTPCIAISNGKNWIVQSLVAGGAQSSIRYTTTARDALVSPMDGALIYNTTQANLNTYSTSASAWSNVVSSNTITSVVSITQAAYNALSPPSPTTFYVITDAPSSGTNIANITTKTGDYTLTSNDYCVNVTATIPTIQTLPSAIGLAGYIFVIKNSGTSTVTVTGSETIDGATSLVIRDRYNSITVQSTGAVWIIL